VITHHAPSRHSLDSTFAGEPINGAYASDFEALVAELQPALWIHGHTHRCVFAITGNRPTSMIVCGERMNDFRRIRFSPSFRRLRPADQAAMHAQSVAWLREELGKDAAGIRPERPALAVLSSFVSLGRARP
jgi:hypothetical protein